MKVTIVIPTYNEQTNIGKLLQEIKKHCVYTYTPLVVDDGDDETKVIALMQCATVLQGQHKGLGQAIIDGINHAKTDIVVVMDADLSHNPQDINSLIRPLLNGYDMAIGSRYTEGGATEGWERSRRIISRAACLLALPITTVKDSTSGFFGIRKEILDGVKLEGRSWKTMLEVLVKAKPTRVIEVPITFKVREQGKSKFNNKQVVAYLKHLFALVLHKYNRFLKFCIVGGTGAVITFGLTWIFTEAVGLWYMASLAIGVIVALVTNFTLNSLWTFAVGKDMNDADYEWDAYYKGNIIQRWWKHSISKKVVAMLPVGWDSKDGLKTDWTILDIGCGSSPIACQINSPNYIGVDGNRKKIEFMRNRLPNYKYYCSDDYNNGHQSDIVMAIEVIEHSPTTRKAHALLMEMSMATKPGGTVIIATPDYSSFMWRAIERVYGILMPSAYAGDHKVKFSEKLLITWCQIYNLDHVKTSKVLNCDMVCQFVKKG